MAKEYRGKVVKREPGWRGVCPVCGKTGVKLLWKKNEQMVCKHCK